MQTTDMNLRGGAGDREDETGSFKCECCCFQFGSGSQNKYLQNPFDGDGGHDGGHDGGGDGGA